ncbi:MAG TPA: tRNA 2-thiouridine(34) synthase MnmA [Chthoniobacteraceae bacterium]|jgi:tRNA-specific 2-thiouridylase|nr:tRNA 2-thiouridine(34) synthase MnmA [Chthoniobacteraceae bacterium]
MSTTSQRVVIGMSGGVDSSVAAHLLKQQGYDVIGVTMKVWPQDCISRAEDKCCGPSAIADARGVAHALGIPHYVVEESNEFQEQVIQYFASEYQSGRTPNPCVMCNEKLKFGNLWRKARSLGAEFIATGHYAIIERAPDGRAILRKGRDPRKDQSYFLFSLRQEQLLHSLMPLGAMSKPEIRNIARAIGLKVAEKEDSQEICFVPGQDYKAFLRGHLGEKQFHAGGIYDKEGHYLAPHEGIEMFTIGQRKGLPGGSPRPQYVIDIDPQTSSVIVGGAEDLIVESFEVDRATWHGLPGGPCELDVKIRYGHAGARATVTPLPGERARVDLHVAQRAVTPGQAAVFYDADRVAGGGWICRSAAPVAREMPVHA